MSLPWWCHHECPCSFSRRRHRLYFTSPLLVSYTAVFCVSCPCLSSEPQIYFLLVRIKIKHMEMAIIRRETAGAGSNQYNESETIVKYEVMDGAPAKGERTAPRLSWGLASGRLKEARWRHMRRPRHKISWSGAGIQIAVYLRSLRVDRIRAVGRAVGC